MTSTSGHSVIAAAQPPGHLVIRDAYKARKAQLLATL